MFKVNRISYPNRIIISLLILMLISACSDSNDKSGDQEQLVESDAAELVLIAENPEPVITVLPDTPLITVLPDTPLYMHDKSKGQELPVEIDTPELVPIVVEAPKPVIIVLPDPPSLGTAYPEYYSGFWRGSSCAGTGFALIGINGMSAEVNTGATFMNSTMGTIDSIGEFLFPSREVNWDCEACGEVRPLTIRGEIDYGSKTGSLIFEVACPTGKGHLISNVHVELKSGISQPSPFNEMQRIKNEIKDLTEEDLTCSSDDQCKMIQLESNDMCNYEAIIYSDATVNEENLFELESEYHRKKWLSGQNSGSSGFTMCAHVRNPVCIESNCTFTSL